MLTATQNSKQCITRTQHSSEEWTHLWCESSRRQHLADELQASRHRLGLVHGQHEATHFAAVADGHIRHELHPSSNHGITVTTSDQTNA